MRVLLIDVNCKHSSTGKIIYDLYEKLNQDGHTAAICYGRGAPVDGPKIFKFSSNIEVYIHAFLTRITGFTGVYSPFATHRLLKFIEEFKPDVVHLHELHAYFVNIAPLVNYLKYKNIKTIWTFHSEFMYTGKCGHAKDCEKWKTECGKCPYYKEYPASFFFDFTKRMFNQKKRFFKDFYNLTIVTPSKWLSGRVKESFLKDKNIQVINNGIDTKNIFYPRINDGLRKKHNLTDEKIVLAVAPKLMSENKGGHWVIKLAEKFKESRVKFILIGVEKIDKEYDENVIVLKKISNQAELAEYYSMADVFLICSCKETFSITSIEALACGTPVCGFRAGGNEEILFGSNTWYVDYGDIDSLAEALHSIINKEFHNNEIADYIKKTYSRENMYEKYLDLYLS